MNTAMQVLRPRDAKDVQSAVDWAVHDGKTLEIVGQGSKRAIGRAAQWDLTLDLSGLSGVTLYEPAELVLSAKAGTPIAEIELLVAQNGQQLAFEPMDFGPIFGEPIGRGTLGGVLATNLSGPRRIKAGAARDHFLGFTAVSGRGETFKSGGRVVKNVTGYDLSKLMAGSWGTLAAMTDVTIKVLPRPETEETVVFSGLDDATALAALNAAMGSAGEVSGAAHLPAVVAARAGVASLAGGSVTVLRLEGVAPSIAHRKNILQALLAPRGPMATLGQADSGALWRAVRDVVPFAAGVGGADRPLWRISTTPMRGAELARHIAAAAEAAFLYDWAGGLVWAELVPSDDAGASIVRDALSAVGGHATLVRAPAAFRAAVDVFDPQDTGVALLSRRIKESFDPRRALNPGRMYAGV
jgi:glycolate oxidase FAD binding subunit